MWHVLPPSCFLLSHFSLLSPPVVHSIPLEALLIEMGTRGNRQGSRFDVLPPKWPDEFPPPWGTYAALEAVNVFGSPCTPGA
jgi:hypothetical protein